MKLNKNIKIIVFLFSLYHTICPVVEHHGLLRLRSFYFDILLYLPTSIIIEGNARVTLLIKQIGRYQVPTNVCYILLLT